MSQPEATLQPSQAPPRSVDSPPGRGVRSLVNGLVRWWATPARRHWQLAIPLLLVISVFYQFMASAGTFQDLRRQSRYQQMAEGFEQGHLYVAREVAPALLRAEDPFYPTNKRYWQWDATLYNGRYYLYWGPVPALLIMGARTLAGPIEVSDQTLTLLFMLGRLYAGAVIIICLATSVRLRQPPWLSVLAIAAFGLTSPIPFTIARPYVYEACLAAGQCFLFCGLAFALWGVKSSRQRLLKFLLASGCWALAIGSRITMVIPVPLIILATGVVVSWRSRRWIREGLSSLAVLGLPTAAAVLAYAVYNYVRFDSVTEFGTTWQASTQRFFTNPVFIFPNIYSYLFAPVKWSCEYPFVWAPAARELAGFIDWPIGYHRYEVVGGLLWLSGWCWLPLALVWRWTGGVRSVLAGSGIARHATSLEGWTLACSVFILFAIAPVLGLWEASMRYTGDAIGGLMLISALSAFWLRKRADASGSRAIAVAARALIIGTGLHTALIGALSGITSYNEPFKVNNPGLHARLQARWSFCGQGSREPAAE